MEEIYKDVVPDEIGFYHKGQCKLKRTELHIGLDEILVKYKIVG